MRAASLGHQLSVRPTAIQVVLLSWLPRRNLEFFFQTLRIKVFVYFYSPFYFLTAAGDAGNEYGYHVAGKVESGIQI